MRKLFLIFSCVFAAMALVACNGGTATQNKSQEVNTGQNTPDAGEAALDSTVQNLLTASAKDFNANRPPNPIGFRDVRVGYMPNPTGNKLCIICGQFLASAEKNNEKWTPFATVKTSDYEQWIGSSATTFCQDSSVVWENTGDLSSLLQNRLDSLSRTGL